MNSNPYLDYLIDLIVQGIDRILVLLFENNKYRTSSKRYFIRTVEIQGYNVMIDQRNLSKIM